MVAFWRFLQWPSKFHELSHLPSLNLPMMKGFLLVDFPWLEAPKTPLFATFEVLKQVLCLNQNKVKGIISARGDGYAKMKVTSVF